MADMKVPLCYIIVSTQPAKSTSRWRKMRHETTHNQIIEALASHGKQAKGEPRE